MRRTPQTPEAKALLSLMSRRGILRGAMAGSALAVTGSALAACGTKPLAQPSSSAGPACATPDASATERTLNFSNWIAYLDEADEDADKHPTLEAFTVKTGIEVKYTADINDNSEYFGKIRQQLAACQTIERDLVVFSDWMAARFIKLGWAQQLEPSKVETFRKNLIPSLRHRHSDPDMSYSAPWQAGLTGLAVNTNYAKEVRNVDEMLTRADLKGKVSVLSEMHDTIGFMLLSMGKDPGNFTEADFDAALGKLEKAIADGQIRRVAGNDYVQDLAKGDIVACIGWSGDVIQLSWDDENIKFITPDEGHMLWSDDMLIPATSTHAANAHALIDYYYDPVVAAELAAWVNYVCPVAGAQEAMLDIDEELAENPLIFPDAAMQQKITQFASLPDDVEKKYQDKFQAVIGA